MTQELTQQVIDRTNMEISLADDNERLRDKLKNQKEIHNKAISQAVRAAGSFKCGSNFGSVTDICDCINELRVK